MPQTSALPQLPEIGHLPIYYQEHVREAERFHDRHAVKAYKVGLYVTRALSHSTNWDDSERCLLHALQSHCVAPPSASEDERAFYAKLAHLVRNHAGREVLRLTSAQDEVYASRLRAGEARGAIARDAAAFFHKFLPHDHRPEWLNEDDFHELKILRAQWM